MIMKECEKIHKVDIDNDYHYQYYFNIVKLFTKFLIDNDYQYQLMSVEIKETYYNLLLYDDTFKNIPKNKNKLF